MELKMQNQQNNENVPNGGPQDPQIVYMQAPQKTKGGFLPLLCSFLFPGLGSMINGHIAKGIMLFLSIGALSVTGVGIFVALPIYFYGFITAYNGN